MKYNYMKSNIIFDTLDISGKIIKSSAILYSAVNPVAIYFIHHGTIFTNDMSPSNASMYDSIAKLFLDKNFSVIFPDYIGFGISYKSSYHPYLHKKSLATNSFDLLNYLYDNNIIDNDIKVISAGYSEGGYASLAFVELAQEHDIIINSINGAAPYDILDSLDKALVNHIYEFPEYISYVAYSYEKIYMLDDLVNNIFKSFYSKITHKAYRDNYTFERMHRIYPKEISRFVNIDFLNGESQLINHFKLKLKENSLKSFIPIGNTTFFSARHDEVVDVNVTIDIYKHMKESGALNLHLIIDEDMNSSHFNSYPKFLKSLFVR